jgi:hypothetical protein
MMNEELGSFRCWNERTCDSEARKLQFDQIIRWKNRLYSVRRRLQSGKATLKKEKGFPKFKQQDIRDAGRMHAVEFSTDMSKNWPKEE